MLILLQELYRSISEPHAGIRNEEPFTLLHSICTSTVLPFHRVAPTKTFRSDHIILAPLLCMMSQYFDGTAARYILGFPGLGTSIPMQDS